MMVLCSGSVYLHALVVSYTLLKGIPFYLELLDATIYNLRRADIIVLSKDTCSFKLSFLRVNLQMSTLLCVF